MCVRLSIAHQKFTKLFRNESNDVIPFYTLNLRRLSMIPAGTNEIMRFIVQREVYKGYEGYKGYTCVFG